MTGQGIATRMPGESHERLRWWLEVAVVLAAVATIPLVVAQEWNAEDPLVVAADWTVWGVFLAEYAAMMAIDSDRWGYARRNWLSAAVILFSFPLMPVLLELVRLGRLIRLVRLVRLVGVTTWGLASLRAILGRPGVIYVGGAAAALILAAAACLDLLEPQTVKGDFWNGVWWAIVTTTTVGYGDIAPVTAGGRVIAAILMFVGIGLFATLGASVAAYFVEQDSDRRESADLRELKERLERVERILQRLEDGSSRNNAQR